MKPLHLLKKYNFNYSTHSFLEMESGYTIYSGLITDFDSSIQFYCNALIEWDAQGQNLHGWRAGWQGWIKQKIEESLCRPVSKDDFPKQVEPIINQMKPLLTLPNFNTLVSALQMTDDWNDISLLAQFENEYFYFHWHTTA